MTNDALLQTRVLQELQWRPAIDAAHIGVTAKDGVITLTGQVAHYAERFAAEEAAQSVMGVQGLANDIHVEIPGSLKKSDQDIAAAALGALKWDYAVPQSKVKVVVNDGWLTLSGAVDWQYQKDAAGRAVRHLMGVKAVSNEIGITPEIHMADVKTKIEESFKRNASLQARRITVATHGGQVTLSGTVSSMAERNEASWSAWSAPGVKTVQNDITVLLP